MHQVWIRFIKIDTKRVLRELMSIFEKHREHGTFFAAQDT